MNKQELILNTMTFMKDEDYVLIRKSGKTSGDIIDNGFTDENRAYVELMSRLHEIYDDLEKEDREEMFKSMQVIKNLDNPLILTPLDASKFSDSFKGLTPLYSAFNIPKFDFTNHLIKRSDN